MGVNSAAHQSRQLQPLWTGHELVAAAIGPGPDAQDAAPSCLRDGHWGFPGAKILVTPGNNDEDCGDYSIQAGGTFLSDTAEMARDLAGANGSFVGDWKALGSYNMPHPAI